jgi:hypothetical protein
MGKTVDHPLPSVGGIRLRGEDDIYWLFFTTQVEELKTKGGKKKK